MLLLCLVCAILTVSSVHSQEPWFGDFGKGFYRERFAGQSFCSTINPTCCASRDDDCSVAIGKTRCYCDVFCDQGQENPWNRKAPDCCPDYLNVCKGQPQPQPRPTPGNFTDCRGKFTCTSGTQCIDNRYRCDGVPQCRDGSDEVGCGCRDDEFTCEGDGSCINRRYKCDGFQNCRDGSDELDCGEFGISLKPDMIYLSDHADYITELEFTCEFKSRHNLRLELSTDPPQATPYNNQLQPERYTYLTTGREIKRLPIRPNINSILCEAFDQYGDEVLFAKARIVNDGGNQPPVYTYAPEDRATVPPPIGGGCDMNELQNKCGKYVQRMQELARNSQFPNTDDMCCILNEQVNCMSSMNCADFTQAVTRPLMAQVRQLCSNFNYVPGCADNKTENNRVLPPNFAKCVNITNATPDTIVVTVTYRDEQGPIERSSAIEGGGAYQFEEFERIQPGRSYRTVVPLKAITVIQQDGQRVEQDVTVTGVQGCIHRTILMTDTEPAGYVITDV